MGVGVLQGAGWASGLKDSLFVYTGPLEKKLPRLKAPGALYHESIDFYDIIIRFIIRIIRIIPGIAHL